MESQLSYKEFQKRNSEQFQAKTKQEQKQLRAEGYNNRGWENVRYSWSLLSNANDRESRELYKFQVGAIVQHGNTDKEKMGTLDALHRNVRTIRELKSAFIKRATL